MEKDLGDQMYDICTDIFLLGMDYKSSIIDGDSDYVLGEFLEKCDELKSEIRDTVRSLM
ncbi:MAG: hypothetical protein OXC46_08040 [Thaumarchaeota archaeon]|nr:hypothetical protein [Nitrososphaerota archaeon]